MIMQVQTQSVISSFIHLMYSFVRRVKTDASLTFPHLNSPNEVKPVSTPLQIKGPPESPCKKKKNIYMYS